MKLTLLAARQHERTATGWVRPFLLFVGAGRQFCLLPMVTLAVPWDPPVSLVSMLNPWYWGIVQCLYNVMYTTLRG